MRRSPHVVGMAGILAVILAANLWLFSGRLTSWATSGALGPAAGFIARSRAFVGIFATRDDLARQNIALQARILELEHGQADADALGRELALARAAVGLKNSSPGALVEAGVIAWPREGGVREVVIDRGAEDGITSGDVAATPEGALVGIVRDVHAHEATLIGLGDPAFQAATTVLNSTISGLTRADGSGDLILDLVRKGEAIQEGQMLATSGNDGLPPGLIIGSVRSVELPAASLFALVHVTSAVDVEAVGRVMVLTR